MATTTACLTIPKPSLILLNHSKPIWPKPSSIPLPPHPMTTTLAKNAAVLTTMLSTLATSPPAALAAKKIAESPEHDIRGLAFLVPIVPAVGWALFNILGPALNQIERMRVQRAVILGLGLGGLAAAAVQSAYAAEGVEEVSVGGNNGVYLAGFVAAAAALEVVLLSSKLKESESEEKRITE